jgi:hypothetical protein
LLAKKVSFQRCEGEALEAALFPRAVVLRAAEEVTEVTTWTTLCLMDGMLVSTTRREVVMAMALNCASRSSLAQRMRVHRETVEMLVMAPTTTIIAREHR